MKRFERRADCLLQSAKRILIAALSLSFVFISACQPTPDKPFVESKNDGELEAAIYGSAAPMEKYEAPETWQETFSSPDGNVVVNIDAKITVPDVTAFPVYRVDSPAFTEQEMTDFITKMTNGEKLYTADGSTRTKADIEADIEKIMSAYEPNSDMMKALESGELSEDEFNYYKEQDDKRLIKLQEEYKQTPAEASYVETPLQFKKVEPRDGGDEYIFFNAITMNGDASPSYVEVKSIQSKPYGAFQVKYYNSSASKVWAGFEYGAAYQGEATESGRYGNLEHIRPDRELIIPYDEAKALADGIFEKLGYENYYMARASYINRNVYDGVDEFKTAYAFKYMPVVDDVPVLHYLMDKRDNEGNMYHAETYPHCVTIFVRDAERYEVYEQSKLVLKDKLTTNAKLLPFDEIKDICRKYMPIAADTASLWSFDDGVERITYDVKNIELGYMAIREKNNNDSGILIPVWNLYGNETQKFTEEGKGQLVLDENNENTVYDVGDVFLCINALDGSIINPDLGY